MLPLTISLITINDAVVVSEEDLGGIPRRNDLIDWSIKDTVLPLPVGLYHVDNVTWRARTRNVVLNLTKID